jgi:hypothetical protein
MSTEQAHRGRYREWNREKSRSPVNAIFCFTPDFDGELKKTYFFGDSLFVKPSFLQARRYDNSPKNIHPEVPGFGDSGVFGG